MSSENKTLIGIGLGPFNLSLAALLEKIPEIQNVFLEKKSGFDWHPEIMFQDSTMQTTYLKDLVTPVDPTNPNSFLNYLVSNGLFYQFLNTQRSVVTRREFEKYCTWVSQRLSARVAFNTEVRGVHYKENQFEIETSTGLLKSKNICVGTGMTARVPDCARLKIGPRVFHAKSKALQNMDLKDKSILIVGGGQTGIEIFRNAMQGKWGQFKSLNLITQRKNLEPLDESAFTNEYFTPDYARTFWSLSQEKKSAVVAGQKLASDGNTPAYLSELFRDLYHLKHVEGDARPMRLMACRQLTDIQENADQYRVQMQNQFQDQNEEMIVDYIVLCTGFQSLIPPVLEPLFSRIHFDAQKRFQYNPSYAIQWDGPKENKIYALNFSREQHGIFDPQTSMMAWRSAVVINDLAGKKIFQTAQNVPNFVDYGINVNEPQEIF